MRTHVPSTFAGRLRTLLLAAAATASLAAVPPAAAAPPLGSMTVTGLDPDGVEPDRVGMTTRVIAGSYGNFLGFTYTAGRDPLVDSLSVDVPAAWQGSPGGDDAFSADKDRYETPGFARVKQGSCTAPGELSAGPSASGSGSTLQLVGFACDAGQSLSIELFYVGAPAKPGDHAFPTRVEGVGLPPGHQPSLRVHPVPDVALVLSEVPASVSQDEPFDVVVTAVRDDGKVHRGYRGTARFVGLDCSGVADVTFTPRDRGTRRISGVRLGQVGEQQFGFRDVGNTARSGAAVTTVTSEEEDPSGCGGGVRFH